MNFCTRLRQLRKDAGYTQEYLAKLMGVTASSIGLYEQNRREPDNETVKKFAKLFNVSVDYILGFDNDETSYSFAAYQELMHDLSPDKIKQLQDYANFLRQQK